MQRADRAIQYQLRERRLARLQPLTFQQRDPAHDFGCAQMDMHRCPVRQWSAFRGEQAQLSVEPLRRRMHGRSQHPVSTLYLRLVEPLAHQVEGAALSGHAYLRRLVLCVDGAHPHFDPWR